ncbi:MAG: proA [Burkholderiales bacterium]|jgi:glutamate-5-semialdehyde dehydrogenase|nr:proA [Burkholderiales bacterium]
MKNEISQKFTATKSASYDIISEGIRYKTLIKLSELISQKYQLIIDENKKDLNLMNKEDPKYDRLELNQERILAIASDVVKVAKLPFEAYEVLESKVLPNNLELKKQKVPLGVVAAIYESRPNVTIDVFSLCFRSGNACILKGGKEAHFSNEIFYSLIKEALAEYQLNLNWVYLMPPHREAVYDLLNATDIVDVCIPRGSQQLIDFVRENAKIPVIETGAGIVHTYFDVNGDLAKGKLIINNAKTRRVSVCNALDTLIIHRERLNHLPDLVEPLLQGKVEIFADAKSYAALKGYYPDSLLFLARNEDFGREFLSYKMSVKTVDDIDEALSHIRRFSSKHSEAIITEDLESAEYFLMRTDAAAVYVNASTGFTDGGEFGMGAEVGISTQKLHVRGPIGLEALTSYKWLVYGTGQIRK